MLNTIKINNNLCLTVGEMKVGQFFIDGKLLMQKVKDSECDLTYIVSVEDGLIKLNISESHVYRVLSVDIIAKYIQED